MNKHQVYATLRDYISPSHPIDLKLSLANRDDPNLNRFGYALPRYVDLDDGGYWLLLIAPDVIADQLYGVPQDHAQVYLNFILFSAYTHVTYLLDGITDYHERTRLVERDALALDEGQYLHVVSNVQLNILDQIGAV